MGYFKTITKEDGEAEAVYVSNWHDKETEQYQEEHKRKVSDEDAQFILDKIARHFKLGKFRIRFYGYRDSGQIAYGFMHEVRLSHNPSFALICHELVHPVGYKRYKKQIAHGCKKWRFQLARIVNYCRKQNFWEEELQRRKEAEKTRQEKYDEEHKPKEKTEIRSHKIELLEARMKRYEKKIISMQRGLKKAQKRLNRLKKFQEKEVISSSL